MANADFLSCWRGLSGRSTWVQVSHRTKLIIAGKTRVETEGTFLGFFGILRTFIWFNFTAILFLDFSGNFSLEHRWHPRLFRHYATYRKSKEKNFEYFFAQILVFEGSCKRNQFSSFMGDYFWKLINFPAMCDFSSEKNYLQKKTFEVFIWALWHFSKKIERYSVFQCFASSFLEKKIWSTIYYLVFPFGNFFYFYEYPVGYLPAL